ncbi:hypothetical protein [Sediminibacterium soli]|uniref:hypothetical protein n=1 Tax=Sediminibacterium soli TaxID=2698829 RepID=UPI00137B1269|nr:hypothetical protein [Sediminibacterium soli]NCI47719.1 hypothetical protein [Sediminibacterium soli]
MDELKKYLRQHADELDLDEPRSQVWERISGQTAVKKTNVVTMVTRWAVAACVLVLAGIGIWHLVDSNSKQTRDTAQLAPGPVKNRVPATPQTHEPQTIRPEVSTEPITARTETAPRQNRMANSAKMNKADMHALTDIENSFTQVINLQRARVSTMPMYAETPAYFDDFKVQLKQMERDEKSIKTDIARRGLNDALLDQLINLYQQKLNILKQLQLEMNKTNNRFKQNRGPVDSTRTYFLNI